MRLDRLIVKNFRNLADIDIALSGGTVIVGENRSGKSNLIEAIRLVLDSSMSQADRELQKEDFWSGLSDGSEDWDPQRNREEILVAIEISDFQDTPAVVTALSHALVNENPMRARLTYVWGPTAAATDASPRYLARVYGGENQDNTVSGDLRSYLHLVFLHALRDAERDLSSWRRSPLRKLLTRAAEAVSEESLEIAREAIAEANETMCSLEQVKALGDRITRQTKELAGDFHGLETTLAIASQDPLRLLRTMRLFVDSTRSGPCIWRV